MNVVSERATNYATPPQQVNLFIINIQQAAWDGTPHENRKKFTNIIYPAEVRELVNEKRKARKKWQNFRTPVNNNKLNRLSKKLKKTLPRDQK